jgi:hypothetical protein
MSGHWVGSLVIILWPAANFRARGTVPPRNRPVKAVAGRVATGAKPPDSMVATGSVLLA